MILITDMRGDIAVTSKLKAMGGCSSRHLQGAGVYRAGRTTGRTAAQLVSFYYHHRSFRHFSTAGLKQPMCCTNPAINQSIDASKHT